MNAIYDLMTQQHHTAAYKAKMLHAVPDAPVMDRVEYILQLCAGKIIMDIGCTGELHHGIEQVAKKCYGMDIVECPDVANFYQVDIDHVDKLPTPNNVQLVIAGEVIEHLSNAGHFLNMLHVYNCDVVITTPNAFSSVGRYNLDRNGIENVNVEHVAWYSWHTLKVLVERHGFEVIEWLWYNGKPLTAEGLIFRIR
jgi:hypothetical protein